MVIIVKRSSTRLESTASIYGKMFLNWGFGTITFFVCRTIQKKHGIAMVVLEQRG